MNDINISGDINAGRDVQVAGKDLSVSSSSELLPKLLEVHQLALQAHGGADIDKSRLEQLMVDIGAMSVDIAQVVIATVLNPIQGLEMVVSKIQKRIADMLG